jgi:DNA-binding winged helix-turn-helix (wHTH) protein
MARKLLQSLEMNGIEQSGDGAGSETYAFGEFFLDVTARQLFRAGELVHAEPKVFDLLVDLVRHRDRVVVRQELFERLWPNTAVCPGALHQCVWALRRMLGEPASGCYVKTLHRRGYRFTAPTRVESESGFVPRRSSDVVWRAQARPAAAQR